VPIWCVVNQKGGVGKTTTAVNVASGLAKNGKKTLLIDCDPQGNATTGFGIEKNNLEFSLYDVIANLVEDPETLDAVHSTLINAGPLLDVVPATLDLAGAEPILMNAVGKELILKDALSQIRSNYDWIILDAPPSLGLLTINILAASDAVIVPMQCEFYALEGLSQLMKTVEIVKKRLNPSLKIAKVVLTMYDARNKLTEQVATEIRNFFGSKVATTVIPRNVRLSEAPSFGAPAVVQFPSSKGATAYMSLVDEIIRETA
jgi:chromosome partitioning protein